MCVSVSALIGGKSVFPPRTIFHCCTSIDEQKITCYTSKAFQHLTVTKLAAGLWPRPMFIKGAFVTSPTQLIETDWEIIRTSAGLSLPLWTLANLSLGYFVNMEQMRQAGGGRSDSPRSNYVFFSLPCFFFCPQWPYLCVLVCLLGSDSLIYGTGCVFTVVTILSGSHDTRRLNSLPKSE